MQSKVYGIQLTQNVSFITADLKYLQQVMSRRDNPVLTSVLAGNVSEIAAMACTDDDLVALSLGDDHAATQARYRQWLEDNGVEVVVAAGLIDEGVVLVSVARYARVLQAHLKDSSLTSCL